MKPGKKNSVYWGGGEIRQRGARLEHHRYHLDALQKKSEYQNHQQP
jgi:hypothetical protein